MACGLSFFNLFYILLFSNVRFSLKIMQWNCRAVKSNAAQLIQHISHVDYEIMSLQSLHCRPGDLPRLEGYYYPPVCGPVTPAGRVMVFIYIKLNVQASEVAETSGPPNGYSCAVRVRIEVHGLRPTV